MADLTARPKASARERSEHRVFRKWNVEAKKKAPALRQEPDGGWMRGLCVPFKSLDG